MVQFLGYLLGKVQLDGAIRSEILTSLVESLLQRCQSSPSESGKKLIQFDDSNKYAVECTELGLKLASPSLMTKSKDEGFESDCDSIRSGKVTDSKRNVEQLLDLSDLMDFLDISKEKEPESQVSNNKNGNVESSHNLHNSLSSGASSGGTLDNTSISSNSNLHATLYTDDSHSSSGNGSDSDEFCSSAADKPWESLPNASSFQSFPIEDVVFCHCDPLHSSTLVWVIRHSSKMIALVTTFRSQTEANDLFQVYRELRVKLKPVKYGSTANSSSCHDSYIATTNGLPRPSTPASDLDSLPFTSLPVVYPMEILHETQLKSPIFSSTKSLDFDSKNSSSSVAITLNLREPLKMNTFGVRSPLTSSHGSSSIPMQSIFSNSLSGSSSFLSHHHLCLMSHDDEDDDDEVDGDDESDEVDETEEGDSTDNIHSLMESLKFNTAPKSFPSTFFNQTNSNSMRSKVFGASVLPIPPIRAASTTGSVKMGKTARKAGGASKKPILLVPLKTEDVTTPRSRYPKESYLYHVMGRSSSTFAPYQRPLNFVSTHHGMYNSSNNLNVAAGGPEALGSWNNNRQLQCIPFSSWLELAEMPKIPHANGVTVSTTAGGRKFLHNGLHKHKSNSRSSSTGSSSLAGLNFKGSNKGTSKILLRDASGYHHGMWATLSQRFKRNLRDNLIPKLNWMWTPPGQNRSRRKVNKEVTFNAWATVQMI